MRLLEKLDASLMATQATKIRPGHECTVDIPASIEPIMEADMWDGINVHFPVTFDDEVSWLVRVRRLRYDDPPGATQELVISSEVATIRFMHRHGLRVPNAWNPAKLAHESFQKGEFEFCT